MKLIYFRTQFNHYSANKFLKYYIMLSAYTICCIYSNALQNTFTKVKSTMDPDRTVLEQSDQGPYCLQYRLPKNISRRESRQQNSRLAEKG